MRSRRTTKRKFAINLKSIFILFMGILLLMSCQTQLCPIDFRNFVSHEAPLIHITKQKENGEYRFEGYFWFPEKRIISEGDLIFDCNAILLKIDLLNSGKIRYFDFSKKIGERYSITFDSNNSSLNESSIFSAQIENIVPSIEAKDVYIFRINNAFIDQRNNYTADIVYFVTKENGIIGSYISKIEDGVEHVIERRGDVLENIIDYSKKKFGNIG